VGFCVVVDFDVGNPPQQVRCGQGFSRCDRGEVCMAGVGIPFCAVLTT
jgi:hypothetical protein